MRLIDADEAVRTIRRMAKNCILRGKLQEGEEYAIAASVLNRKELADVLNGRNVNDYIQQLESQVPKWINIKEQMPEGECLAGCFARGSYGYGEYIIGYVSPYRVLEGSGYFAENSFVLLDDVTHWMPLPEPPKEDNHAEND